MTAEMAEEPDDVSVVVVGHVDHGKSTLIGRLLYETGKVGDAEIRETTEEAAARDNETSKFAFVMDRFEEERDRMVTIDTRSRSIALDGKDLHFADAPGHRKWIRNVIMGSLYADAALLVVRSDRGIEAQTREHAWLTKRLFGIDQAVIAVEMMDLVDYDEDRFEAVRAEIEDLLDTVEHTPDEVTFVPVAAYQGENITAPSDEMPWWDGPVLTAALQDLRHETPPADVEPRFLCLESFRDISRESVMASGVQLEGTYTPGDRVRFLPGDETVDVAAIENLGEEVDTALPEDRVTMVVDDSASETDSITVDDIQRGFLAVPEESDINGDVSRFTAELYVCKGAVAPGDEMGVWVYGRTVPATIDTVREAEDAVSGEDVTGELTPGTVATVALDLEEPVFIQPIEETRRTSMFILLDEEMAVGYGNAVEVER